MAQGDFDSGCERGRAVSDLASSKAENRQGDGPAEDPCDNADNDGNVTAGSSRATGKAWGHGDPPGRKLGHAKQNGTAGDSAAIDSGGAATSHGPTFGKSTAHAQAGNKPADT